MESQIHSEIESLSERIRDLEYYLNGLESQDEIRTVKIRIKQLKKRKELKERLYEELYL
ncbi:hypothetical protein [Heyndrickxia sporothermodurans]|uniref:DUF465 domain-containing protein n=1 Tax=Heyndrickxia sporothermodurans TaxID=46224 RepID=A0AB37HCB6_9BACI|nr:hypothetical protein [Heyndrickxia sporothermodurans]MBL5769028.1 hypothetical protein [Heyndrickxia sporothermodurans]MBL5772733.1 hypothetical protein [Heyndrickxia sporothermodurans]MBL5783435.1 hypothetical protein [Heyndrickxia sporothermodurans]MBL5786901.1 hypothetical protein [Heyndrickxia sporothermodurans]MBL5790448.1 hypothetical protein [Heyndrickxia sporothermodurans]